MTQPHATTLQAFSSQENRHVVFTGNGYSAEWRQEAAKRGLPNLKLGEEREV